MDKPTSVREASRLTGVPRSTIYDYVRKQAIEIYRTPSGRVRVIPRDCLPKPGSCLPGPRPPTRS